jgi:hypothetical protein
MKFSKLLALAIVTSVGFSCRGFEASELSDIKRCSLLSGKNSVIYRDEIESQSFVLYRICPENATVEEVNRSCTHTIKGKKEVKESEPMALSDFIGHLEAADVPETKIGEFLEKIQDGEELNFCHFPEPADWTTVSKPFKDEAARKKKKKEEEEARAKEKPKCLGNCKIALKRCEDTCFKSYIDSAFPTQSKLKDCNASCKSDKEDCEFKCNHP